MSDAYVPPELTVLARVRAQRAAARAKALREQLKTTQPEEEPVDSEPEMWEHVAIHMATLVYRLTEPDEDVPASERELWRSHAAKVMSGETAAALRPLAAVLSPEETDDGDD